MTVTVDLSAAPEREVTIPLTAANENGASSADYTVPASVTFASGDTSKTVTFSATPDNVDDDDERVRLGFSTLPAGVTAGTPNQATVSITDDDVPPGDQNTGDLPPVEYNTGDLRLVDGVMTDDNGRPCEGRLEIYYNGEWGTICDDYWSAGDADVSCRQLGFAGGSVDDWSFFRNSIFPMGDEDQPIWLDDLHCDGGESSLLECNSSQPAIGVHNCTHVEDVLLRCLKNTGPWIVDMEFSEPAGGDGSYDAGETVEVTLVWSEAVTVTSTPKRLPILWLSYGGQPVPGHYRAHYESGSGTNRTVFTHTLHGFAEVTSFPYVTVSTDSLRLRYGNPQSASISSVATGAPAVLGHRMYQSDESSAATEGQAEATTILGVPAFSDAGDDGVFGAGETVEVTFIFSRPVQVDTTGGIPSVQVLLSRTAARQASYLRGNGASQLVFGYTVTATDGEHRSLLVEPNSLALNDGTIRDAATNQDADIRHQGGGSFFIPPVDADAPVLQSASVDGSSLTLTFDEELDNSESLSSALFAVNVSGEARSVVGVAVGQSNVVLLLSPAVVADDSVTVDYTAPTEETAAKLQDHSDNAAESFIGFSVSNETQAADPPPTQQNSPASGVPTITGTAQVGETLSADTSAISDADGLDPDTFTYQWLGDDAEISGATDRTYIPVADDEGKAIKVRVSFTDDAGNAETLTSAAAAAVTAAVPLLIPEDEEETVLLTAAAHDVPADHDGSATFTFELRFSETPEDDFSYQTLRDHAFTATGGEVVKARRLAQGENVRWQIHVTPDGNGAVTIALPPTTDCAADGAVCTQDGRKLSGRLEVRVTRQNSAASGAPSIQGKRPRRPDPDGGHVGDQRRRRREQRHRRLPVDRERRRHGHRDQRSHGLQLHPGGSRRGQDLQGAGVLHRPRGQRGVADQRGNCRGAAGHPRGRGR